MKMCRFALILNVTLCSAVLAMSAQAAATRHAIHHKPAPKAAVPAPQDLLAFPGAMGWAATTPGGRGGQIIKVTTLANDGPGSLRAAVETRGPRIIVFEVGGVIDLDRQTLTIKENNVTIAGQTAPSPGITLIRGGIDVGAHDVILQHIRVKVGEAGAPKKSGWEEDAFSTIGGAANVIADHCTFTWATDENMSVSGRRFVGNTPDDWRAATSHRITLSNNIAAEGLSWATHYKIEHSKGSLIHDNAVMRSSSAASSRFTIASARWRAAGAKFYDWSTRSVRADLAPGTGETMARLVTSFETSEAEVEALLALAGAP